MSIRRLEQALIVANTIELLVRVSRQIGSNVQARSNIEARSSESSPIVLLGRSSRDPTKLLSVAFAAGSLSIVLREQCLASHRAFRAAQDLGLSDIMSCAIIVVSEPGFPSELLVAASDTNDTFGVEPSQAQHAGVEPPCAVLTTACGGMQHILSLTDPLTGFSRLLELYDRPLVRQKYANLLQSRISKKDAGLNDVRIWSNLAVGKL